MTRTPAWMAAAVLWAPVVCAQPAKDAVPARDTVLAAMKKATTFMVETVSLRGGYVWVVSDDLSQRWGEVPARPSQVWVQAATPMVGMALLDAHEATGDEYYLSAARRAADVLVFGQHPLGGWHYFVDFEPKGLPEWYATDASQFLYGYEEYRHYYGNGTYDDRVTSDAARFLLRLYATTLEPAYREPVLKALEFGLASQYPNGAWPQRYPLRAEFAHDGLPDYTSFYTINDGVLEGNVELMLAAHDVLGDARYFESARRAADFLVAVQGPAGEAAWAEQYGFDMRPSAARTHEPAGYVIRESRDAIRVLERLYLLTGDRRYLAPIPGCLAWFDRVNREALELKRPPARYWQPGTNLPVYVVSSPERTREGYGVHVWTTTPPAGAEVKPAVDAAPIRAEYEAVAALATEAARSEYYDDHFRGERRPAGGASADVVARIIGSLDARGAWVVDDAMVHPRAITGKRAGTTVPIRGISTAVFVRNLRTLTDYVRGSAK